MNIRYRVNLTEAERAQLMAMLGGGRHAARKVKRAQILLAADVGVGDEEIACSVWVGGSTVYRTKRRFVEGNLDLALSEEARPGAVRKLSGKETALLIATACSAPPEGRKRWTLDLLADAMVRLTGHEGLSRETVRRRLVEDDLKPWRCAPYGSAPWPIVPPIMPARQITSRLLQLIGIPPSKPGNQDGAMPSGIAPYGLLRTVEHTDAALVKLLAAVSAPEPAIALRRSLRPLADSRLSACWAPHPA